MAVAFRAFTSAADRERSAVGPPVTANGARARACASRRTQRNCITPTVRLRPLPSKDAPSRPQGPGGPARAYRYRLALRRPYRYR